MNKPFIVELSTKSSVKIDADEVEKVLQAISSGSLVRVKQGIINPSYVTCIIQDKDRIERFFEDTKYDSEKRLQGPKKLEDIYSDIRVLAEKMQVNRLN